MSFFASREAIDRCRKQVTPENRSLLEKYAEKHLADPLFSVVDKQVAPPSYAGYHDYISLSKYWWPDPAKPDGIPWINRDGHINPEFFKYDHENSVKMYQAVTRLIALGHILEKPECFVKAGQMLRRWFIEKESAMTPHLKYAQFVPGVRTSCPWGLIDVHFFCELTDAVSLLPICDGWSCEDLAALKDWFSQFYQWMTHDPQPLQEEQNDNNHALWYDALKCAIAHFIGKDEDILRQIQEKVLLRLEQQINADGQFPAELRRTRSRGYTVFAFRAWAWLARAAQSVGFDLWNHPNQKGWTLKKCFEMQFPFFERQKEWPFPEMDPSDPTPETRAFFYASVEQCEHNPLTENWLKQYDGNPLWMLPFVVWEEQ